MKPRTDAFKRYNGSCRDQRPPSTVSMSTSMSKQWLLKFMEEDGSFLHAYVEQEEMVSTKTDDLEATPSGRNMY